MTNAREAVVLPAGLVLLDPQVAVVECQDCGRDGTGGEYELHLPLDGYLIELRSMGWDVLGGKLLCFDCSVGICPECGESKGNPDCTECQ